MCLHALMLPISPLRPPLYPSPFRLISNHDFHIMSHPALPSSLVCYSILVLRISYRPYRRHRRLISNSPNPHVGRRRCTPFIVYLKATLAILVFPFGGNRPHTLRP